MRWAAVAHVCLLGLAGGGWDGAVGDLPVAVRVWPPVPSGLRARRAPHVAQA